MLRKNQPHVTSEAVRPRYVQICAKGTERDWRVQEMGRKDCCGLKQSDRRTWDEVDKSVCKLTGI